MAISQLTDFFGRIIAKTASENAMNGSTVDLSASIAHPLD
jgi:hypothetical protein